MKFLATREGRAAALGLLLLLLLAAPVFEALAAPPVKKGGQEEIPLQISAARLEADQKERLITFSGDVKAVYGDSILYADQLKVYYESGPAGPPAATPSPKSATGAKDQGSPLGNLGGEGGKIQRIVATGKVRFVQEDKVATAREATYYREREEVVLVGNPQMWQGENTVKGDRILFNLKQNRVMVESTASKRVEAYLYPAAQGTPGGGKIPMTPRAKSKERRP